MDPDLPIPKKAKKESRPTYPPSYDLNAPIPKLDRKKAHIPPSTETNTNANVGIDLNARIPKLDWKKAHIHVPPPSKTNTKVGRDLNARIPKLGKKNTYMPVPTKTNENTKMDMDLNAPVPKLNRKRAYMPPPTKSNESTKTEITKKYKRSTEKPKTMRIGTLLPRQSKPLEFPRDSHITVLSEKPMVLRINTTGVPTIIRSSGRSNKLKSYMEKETDSDFLDTDSEDGKKTKKTGLKKGLKKNGSGDTREMMQVREEAAQLGGIDHVVQGNQVDSPPPGVLPSLWYSRESCIHIWVIEKIIGWKKRPKVEMGWKDESVYELDRDTSRKVQDKEINRYISNPKKRMEMSRISPRKCALVLKAVAEREKRMAKIEEREPCCYIKSNATHEKEEVLLIKWRGRSYIHSSWERASDLERLDPTNNTAKGKVKRYYQSQCTALGMNWKKILEDKRKAGATAHSHGLQAIEGEEQHQQEDDDENVDEEFFSPNFVEVERIMACDENKVDMNVLSKQRELNIRNEKKAEECRQNELLGNEQHSNKSLLDIMDETWDPEDYVRYVVKWKGLQVSEVTWEYWLHIKHDSVNPVEDFWIRQQVPDPYSIELTTKEHPHIREYKKLLESPKFGIPSAQCSMAETGTGGNDLVQNGEDVAVLQLRNYQLEGVNWIIWNWWNKRSCILADEMGLGKTIQSMAFLQQLQRMPTTQVRGPFLIVAPLSLVSQWQSEAAIWTPDMNVVLYHGSMDARRFMVKQEFYYTDQFVPKLTAQKLKRLNVTKFDVLITTYEVAMKDANVLSKIRWKALVVDEAHRLKNDTSRLFVELGNVPRDFCLLLTGTPLQNSTGELWSLLNFCDSSNFASKEEFVEKFGQLSDAKQVSDLHSVLKPYLLRRVKEDVEKSLPPKEETILEVALTPIQKKYYKAIYERNTSFLFKGSKPNNAPSLMNIMMELRKCCNHPFLIKGAEDRIMQEAAAKNNNEKVSDPVVRYRKILADQLVQSSGKMVILMKLLPKLQSGGHKVLIFSQMVRVLDLLEELLKLNSYSYERLDGSTRASARTAAMDRFNKKSYQRFVMLLSTRAGGLGLNLTSADTVIIFDSDWNPQNDLQAMARAHRIGQTRSVKVYRLLTAKTYEMHMFHSASMKLGLDRAVLAHQRQQDGDDEKGQSNKPSKESQAKEIDDLLKKGAYDVFRDDDDSDAKKFLETDIDQILERSSRTVTYGNTQSSISSGLGSFSKASFVTADADGKDIDLDDPDFWAKAVGLEAPVAPIDENILLEKRSRKQVQVFDPFAEFQEEEDLKKEKADLKLKFEKEERKRQKEEKRIKREQEKERKKEDKDAAQLLRTKLQSTSIAHNQSSKPLKIKEHTSGRKSKEKKFAKELLTKKLQRYEQRRVMRSIEEEDPIMEKMKQGWNAHHRDRVIKTTLLFGFGRFCKVRNETNLLSLPIQDIELFTRSYIFQLGLQAAASFLEQSEEVSISQKLLSDLDSPDSIWVARSIVSAVEKYDMYCKHEREMRMPQILAEHEFTCRLRAGEAISALKTISFMTRFNAIIEEGAEDVLNELGQEELGKRGYYSKDSCALDIDMKIRYLSTEEILFAIGKRLNEPWKIAHLSRRSPAPWWDRTCDLGLIIGTFLYGVGNYQAMALDNTLSFTHKYERDEDNNPALRFGRFRAISKAVRNTFDDVAATKLESNSSPSLDDGIETMEKDSTVQQTGAISKDATIDPLNGSAPKPDEDSQHTKIDTMKTEKTDSQPQNAAVTTLSFICKRMKEHLRKATMIDLQNSAQDILTYTAANAIKLDDRLFELVSLIESTESQRSTMSNFHKNMTSTNTNLPAFTALCNALDLTRRKHSNPRNPISTCDFNDYKVALKCRDVVTAPGIPSLSRHGVIALSYIDEELATLISNLYHPFQKSKEKKSSESQPFKEQDPNVRLHIPTIFRENEMLRDGICATFFCLGTTQSPQFIATLNTLSGSPQPTISQEDIQEYVQNTLLPHCAHLCLNGVKDDNIKGRVFPDPCYSSSDHSLSSVNIALALLRKAKVYEAISNAILLPDPELKSAISQATLTNHLPLWWNDDCGVKLIYDIAQNGLLHVSLHRSRTVEGMTFLPAEYIKRQIQQYFFQGSKVQSYILNHCSQKDVNEFVERQASSFPNALAIERFLSVVCNEISRKHLDEEWAFLDLPMPDHDLFQH